MTGTGQKVDQVISLRFPAYAVRHGNHVCWLVHTMREYYDGWDQFASTLSPQGRVKRNDAPVADSRRGHVLSEARQEALHDLAGGERSVDEVESSPSEALHPPPPPRAYRCDGYGDFVFFASRLSPLKRADLLLRALAEPPARRVRAVIGGEGEELPRLQALARELNVADRITFTGRLTDDALVEQLARCRAVVFVPKMEDLRLS
jgi:glycosyltransferase involved in cell wall biosynthesis